MDESQIYARLLDTPSRDRPALIDQLCQHDPQLRVRLEKLIALNELLVAESEASQETTINPPSIGKSTIIQSFDRLPRPFGRYELQSILGEGGMGRVYLAFDQRLERRVAIKIVKPRYGLSKEFFPRFEREAKLAAAISHPGLCPVLDFGEQDEVAYLVMPYVEGRTLAQHLAKHQVLPVATALRLTRKIATALQAAHQAEIVHRDLKPANIMLQKDQHGAPLVMDFGLSFRAEETDPRLTESGAILGTPHYMAPEQIGCNSSDFGPSTDVYGLSCTLYEMLTGRPPFADLQGPDLLESKLTRAPESPSELSREVDPAVDQLLAKGLARKPDRRFQSMSEFIKQIDVVLEQLKEADSFRELVQVADKSGLEVQRPASAPSKGMFWAIGLLVLLLAIIVPFSQTILTFFSTSSKQKIELSKGFVNENPAKVPSVNGNISNAKQPPRLNRDILPVNSVWKGVYAFRRANQMTSEQAFQEGISPGTITLTITTRQQDRFTGIYDTLDGKYAWEISGTVKNNSIDAKIGKALRQERDVQVANTAIVRGNFVEPQWQLYFNHGKDDADMTLTRVK